MKGWYYEGWRHSLAAKGIRTSMLAKEITRVHRPMSKREYLYDDIKFLKNAIANPPDDLPKERLQEMTEELEEKEYAYKSMTSPKRAIYTGEMYDKKSWEERYKGTRGRKPELIDNLHLYLDLMKSPQEKHKDYIKNLKKFSDERAEKLALERIEANILREPERAEGELIGPEVVSKVRLGKKSINEPEKFPELNYAAKRVFKKGKYHFTLSGPEVIKLSKKVESELKPLASKIEVAGSIRRGSETPVDIDLVMIPKKDVNPEKVKSILEKRGKVTKFGSKMIEAKVNGVDTDVYFADKKSYGASLLTYTGSFGHNIGLRRIAQHQHKMLNQYGIFDRKTGKYLAGRTERDIYKELNRPVFKQPEERQ